MTEYDDRSVALLRQMAASAVPVADADQAEEQRAAVVARMRELQLQDQRRRQRAAAWRRRLLWLAAASLPVLAVGTMWYAARAPSSAPIVAAGPLHARVDTGAHGVQIFHSSTPIHVDVSKSAQLRAGDTVITGAQGPADVTMPSGTTVLVAPSTRLSVDWDPAGPAVQERIVLGAGFADISVPKLGPDGSFSVATPDAEIVVHGTRFSVRVYERSPGVWMTDVAVTEGHVSVRHATQTAMLAPGQTWSTAESSDASGAPAPASASSSAGVANVDVPAAPTSPVERRGPPPNSLGEENSLFESALAAERGGDDTRAIALFDRLLSEYPGSPLAGVARRERARAQQRLEDRETEHNP